MGNRQRPAETRQAPLVQDLADQAEVLVQHQLLSVADGDAGRFLATVLEREDAQGSYACGIRARGHRAEDAAHGYAPSPDEALCGASEP